MEWKQSFTFAQTSLTLEQLKWRLSQAKTIGENKEEYLKAIKEVEKVNAIQSISN